MKKKLKEWRNNLKRFFASDEEPALRAAVARLYQKLKHLGSVVCEACRSKAFWRTLGVYVTFVVFGFTQSCGIYYSIFDNAFEMGWFVIGCIILNWALIVLLNHLLYTRVKRHQEAFALCGITTWDSIWFVFFVLNLLVFSAQLTSELNSWKLGEASWVDAVWPGLLILTNASCVLAVICKLIKGVIEYGEVALRTYPIYYRIKAAEDNRTEHEQIKIELTITVEQMVGDENDEHQDTGNN